MAEPFERRSGDGALSRVLGRRGKASAVREVEDLLARAGCVRDVASEEVESIAEAHGCDLEKRFGTQRRNLYKRFLEHCLLDCELSEEESEDLEHLRRLLRLSDADAGEVHENVARGVYGRAIDQVLEDHRLEPEEEVFLRRLRSQLQLTESEAKSLEQEGVARARHRFLERSASYDNVWLASEKTMLELRGCSGAGVEGAVADALSDATRALPDLQWAEVTEIRLAVRSGGVSEWRVKLKAGLTPDEGSESGEGSGI
jgi:flavin-binding protein dodecin